MTIRECYNSFGGDYDDVLKRLGSNASVEKFAEKFLDDRNYGDFLSYYKKQEFDLAFRAAHTLKGVSLSLGFSRLIKSSSEVTDALRNGNNAVSDAMLKTLTNDYMLTYNAIKAWKSSKNLS